MKKSWILRLSTIVSVLALVLSFSAPAFASTTADVTITATPEYLAMTLSDGGTNTWAIGAIAESTTAWWTTGGTAPAEPFVDGDMKATVTNTGSVAENFKVHGHAFTGGVGWTIGGAGADAVTIKWGVTGCANIAAMTTLTTSDVEQKHEVAASGTYKFCMSLLTGTFTDGVAKSGTVTFTCEKHT